jgi:hypothetical protein
MGVIAGWFVDILCLEQVYSVSCMVVMWNSYVHGCLNLCSFVKSMSWHVNVIIIDGEKQAKIEVETLVRRVSSRLQKWRRQQNKIHRKI